MIGEWATFDLVPDLATSFLNVLFLNSCCIELWSFYDLIGLVVDVFIHIFNKPNQAKKEREKYYKYNMGICFAYNIAYRLAMDLH